MGLSNSKLKAPVGPGTHFSSQELKPIHEVNHRLVPAGEYQLVIQLDRDWLNVNKIIGKTLSESGFDEDRIFSCLCQEEDGEFVANRMFQIKDKDYSPRSAVTNSAIVTVRLSEDDAKYSSAGFGGFNPNSFNDVKDEIDKSRLVLLNDIPLEQIKSIQCCLFEESGEKVNPSYHSADQSMASVP